MRRSPPRRPASRIWNPMSPTISRGPRIVPTQNHLVRTRSMNSRRMIARTLRTGHLRAGVRPRRVRPHEIDEDLVQRRRDEFELRESRARRHERFEDLLRVRSGRELELGVLAEVLDLRHKAPVGEYLGRPAVGPIERHGQVPRTMLPLHLSDSPIHSLLPAGDDADVIADLLGV